MKQVSASSLRIEGGDVTDAALGALARLLVDYALAESDDSAPWIVGVVVAVPVPAEQMLILWAEVSMKCA
jgi:hypothetical protein